MVLCVLGAGLLLPLDATQMLGLGLLALALHVGFTWTFPLSANLPILVGTASSVVIATVGARELARSRRAEFDGRRAREELVRARSDFVAMLTHDLRNPMAVIDGYVQMLLAERDLTLAARDELLIQVQRAARTALELAGEFLDASKIEAGRFFLKPTRTVDVDDVLRRVLGDHRSHATQRGIALWHDEAVDLPAIEADAAALGRVFTNLIGNAIKHTSAGGSVRVVARRAGADRIEVVVEDTGEGLPPGMESRVFDRYTGVATRADSTGLGLFIASTITAAHGGTIAAENRRDRRGARFRVVLPVTTVVGVSGSA
jgi:two-component system sensor histidine kinase VicK